MKPALLSPEARRALLFAPITTGILATQHRSSAKGWGGADPNHDAKWQPCLDRNRAQTTGRQRVKQGGAQ